LSLDLWLLLAGVAGNIAVLGLFAYRRTWRAMPWFCGYIFWNLIGDCVGYAVLHFRPRAYLDTYFAATVIDSALQFCVLVELAWSVFRPFRASLPRHTVWVLAILIAILGAVIWPFADYAAFARFSMEWRLLGRFEQTDSVLRVLIFLVLAAFSQLLSISWRDRELQVATGLGFYSLVSLAVSMMHSHMAATPNFRRLDQLVVATYVGSLLYWIFSFSQKEAERREFSPQMQGVLLAVAGAARSTRIAMTDSISRNPRNDRRP